MRSFVALSFVVAAVFACSGPQKKPEGAIVETGSDTPDDCCCKSNPMTSEDGRPVFEHTNRMECSSKQGECMDEVQCANQKPQGGPDEGSPAPLEPSVNDNGG